jgi:paraquat-inducible protein B
MSKTANPATIGGFVLGGILLLATATMLFGGSELFAKQERMIAYFPGSVKGLRSGANVLFRGVRIGYVEEIQLQGDADTGVTLVQVTLRINPDQYQVTRKGKVLAADSAVAVSTGDLIAAGSLDLINAGLRAQLGVESFVTGQLVVEFDFFPGSEETYRGVNPPYPEIPTIPNNIEQLVENVQSFVADIQQNLDIVQVSKDLQAGISGFQALMNSPDLKGAIAGVDKLVNSADAQQLAQQLGETLTETRTALRDASELMTSLDEQVEPLMGDLSKAMRNLDATLVTAQSTLQSADEQLRGDTQLSYQLVDTLQAVDAAARSLSVLLDLIDRDPQVLLRGKRKQ